MFQRNVLATCFTSFLVAGPVWAGESSHAFIVEASSSAEARALVERVGGTVQRELPIIHAVGAKLGAAQAKRLRSVSGLVVFEDRSLKNAATLPPPPAISASALGSTVFTDGNALSIKGKYDLNYPMLVGADLLQTAKIDGKDITIAVLDSGFWGEGTDTVKGRIVASVDLLDGGKPVKSDPYGHGTHITSIAAGQFGIAPQAKLAIVRAFDQYGGGSYTDVIAGLNWILANQARYKIRVVNLSFGAPPQSNYWDDPLNQAVMALWRAGVVVVAAAGNEGPDPMTIGVPGNVPYIITVGAVTDNYTPFNASDDKLATFSSAGPTFEGFVKPEVVAPGGHLV
jgi:serine protease AprX